MVCSCAGLCVCAGKYSDCKSETFKGFFKVPLKVFMVFLATIWVQNHKWLKPLISCLIHCILRSKMANNLISRQRWSCTW